MPKASNVCDERFDLHCVVEMYKAQCTYDVVAASGSEVYIYMGKKAESNEA